ncbi:hypothetical protein FB451DRAFT_1189236 [Mycena latifolia]|nr:hypothetical protein FB451DRAFT_1189236 [Mycena latifolia]
MAFSNTAASSGETCMSLHVSCLTGPQSQSFEVRIANYLASYRATPPPYPTDPAARAAPWLPPLRLDAIPRPRRRRTIHIRTAACPLRAPPSAPPLLFLPLFDVMTYSTAATG